MYLLAALYTVAALAFRTNHSCQGKGTIESLPASDQNAHLPYNTATIKRQAILTTANDLIGTPYVWGGNDLSGFDCSGFIEYIFKANGLYMPRTTNQQQYFGQPVDLKMFNLATYISLRKTTRFTTLPWPSRMVIIYTLQAQERLFHTAMLADLPHSSLTGD